MDDGCVTRAYAWAGETIWNQGAKTLAENGLGMKCSGYGEESGSKPVLATRKRRRRMWKKSRCSPRAGAWIRKFCTAPKASPANRRGFIELPARKV